VIELDHFAIAQDVQGLQSLISQQIITPNNWNQCWRRFSIAQSNATESRSIRCALSNKGSRYFAGGFS